MYELLDKVEKTKDGLNKDFSEFYNTERSIVSSGKGTDKRIGGAVIFIRTGLYVLSDYKEILTNYDTCQIVEVNPNVFACAIYTSKQIKVFNNNGKDYPLLGVISNAERQGSNSNGMAKINDRIFCSGGKNYYIYIVGVNPVQMIQKIKLVKNESLSTISFMHMSNSGYLFTSYNNKL